jgi:hypothetical protein
MAIVKYILSIPIRLLFTLAFLIAWTVDEANGEPTLYSIWFKRRPLE